MNPRRPVLLNIDKEMTMRFPLPIIAALALLVSGCSPRKGVEYDQSRKSLKVVAIGDAGDRGSILRGNARYVNDMYSGSHDAGKPDAVIFLGDNFYPIGLNIPADDVRSTIKGVLGPFRPTLEGLGRSNIHAVAGNHDYYARNVIDKSLLFGLVNIVAGPVGISDRGNERAKAIEWWTYYYRMPASVVYPVMPGSGDSVQFILFDSALPLRTDPSEWTPALDSLRSILSSSARNPGIAWRVLVQHHPWYSVGEHGGYSVWDDVERKVTYLPNCDKDSNVVNWFMNTVDPEDMCADKYQAMLDSLRSVIHSAGTKIQFTMTGHDHSLQLLSYPDDHHGCDVCPRVHIVSGAGAKTSRVKFPSPPNEFTSSRPEKNGESLGGFAHLIFDSRQVNVVFYDAASGDPIDMGKGKSRFVISNTGTLMP